MSSSYTIGSGGDYSTIALWSAAVALLTPGGVDLGTIITAANFAGAEIAAGRSTTSENYAKLTVQASVRHAGIYNTTGKAYLDQDPGWNAPVINVLEPYFVVEYLQVKNSGGGSSGSGINLGATGARADACIVALSPGSGIVLNAAGATCRNCLSHDCTYDGVYAAAGGEGSICQNCTAAQCVDGGFFSSYVAVTWTNCLGYGNTGADFRREGSSTMTVTYCASEDSTADDWTGDGNRIDQTFTFEAGTDNYHLASNDAGARNWGVDLSSTFTTDIDGETRPTGAGTWDIGCDEYIAMGGPDDLSANLADPIIGGSTF